MIFILKTKTGKINLFLLGNNFFYPEKGKMKKAQIFYNLLYESYEKKSFNEVDALLYSQLL